MASDAVLVDSGPLVALLDRRDTWHEWAVEQLADLKQPLFTCDAILSETFFLLRQRIPSEVQTLCEMISRELLRSSFDFTANREHVLTLLNKYQDLPASFADACLVAMAEAIPEARIFTVDSDFKIYRKRNRRVLPLIYPG